MIFDGCHFTYGDFDSRSYDLVFAHCDTESYNQIAGDINTSYVFNKKNLKRYVSGNIYEDSPIEFEAEIVTCNGLELTKRRRREVEKLLFNQLNYRRLYICPEDDYSGQMFELRYGSTIYSYLNCRFINPIKIYEEGDKLRGYKFTVECDSNMLWQNAIREVFDVTTMGVNPVVEVEVDTDIKEYTYPKVTIEMGSTGGDISIINNSDESTRITQFTGLSPNITLVIDGRINFVSGQNYEKFTNLNFIRLLDGTNSFSLSGDIKSIEFEWNNRRYI